MNLVIGTRIVFISGAFDFDTWFNIEVIADYSSGELSVKMDGATLPLSGNSPSILSGSLVDVDLWSVNLSAQPTVGAIFIDNYRVISEELVPPRPTLSIAPVLVPIGAPPEWHLSWSAAYFDWILESTLDIESAFWTNEGVTPSLPVDGMVGVDLFEAPPRAFYRLRRP